MFNFLTNLELNNFTYIMTAFVVSVILFLVMMIYYKVRISKLEQYVDYLKVQKKNISEIEHIASKIEKDIVKSEPRLTNYEDEMEDKAIISYQELLKKDKQGEYVKEEIKPKYSDLEYTKASIASLYDNTRFKEKPVQEEIRHVKKEEDIKPVDKEFLNTLIMLRSNLK